MSSRGDGLVLSRSCHARNPKRKILDTYFLNLVTRPDGLASGGRDLVALLDGRPPIALGIELGALLDLGARRFLRHFHPRSRVIRIFRVSLQFRCVRRDEILLYRFPALEQAEY